MGKEQSNIFYDTVFSKSELYHMGYLSMRNAKVPWANLWERTGEILKEQKINTVLDIGSGMGQFGQLVQSMGIPYKGIDFSKYAIEHSKKHAIGAEEFVCVDIFKYDFEDEVDCYTSHEFLEHVEQDLEIFKKLKSNKFIVFSVPSFNYEGHVRWFKNEQEVFNRYSPFVNNLRIEVFNNRQHFLGWGITK